MLDVRLATAATKLDAFMGCCCGGHQLHDFEIGFMFVYVRLGRVGVSVCLS